MVGVALTVGCGSDAPQAAVKPSPDSGAPGNVAAPEAAAHIVVAAGSGTCSAAHGVLAFPQDSRVFDRLACNLESGCDPADFVVTDGEDDGAVTCSVQGAGSGFNVNASVASQGSNLQLSGNVSSTGGTVRITHFYRESGVSLSGDCTLTIARGRGTVSAGRLWAPFTCATLTDPSSAGATDCKAEGAVLFQKCDDGS